MKKRKGSKETLTNEILAEKYQDNFDLALHAISIAQNQIYSGKEFSIDGLLNNMAKGAIEVVSKEVSEEGPDATPDYDFTTVEDPNKGG